MRGMLSRFIGSAIALPLVAIACFAWPAAAAFPERPVTFVVPFAPGSSNDTRARLIAPALSEQLGQPVIVENKPGGGAMIGIEHVAKAAPDGYTLLFVAGALTQAPALRKQVRWDPVKDIQPVSELGSSTFGIAVSSKIKANNLSELIDLLKKNPGKINAGASGNSARLAMVLFQVRTGTTFEIVDYSGTGQAATALASGEVDLNIMDSAAYLPLIESKKIRVLAIANDERLATYPNTPTTVEQGLDYEAGSIFGVYAPGKTPEPILNRLNEALTKVIANPEVNKRFTSQGLFVKARPVKESTERYRKELVLWKEMVAKAGIKPQ